MPRSISLVQLIDDGDGDLTGELVRVPSDSAVRDRPTVDRLVLIVHVTGVARSRGAVIPSETRRLLRRAIWALGPRGWLRLWRALRAVS